MKEDNMSSISSVVAANFAAISASEQRCPSYPYPFVGQTFPYIPWEWVSSHAMPANLAIHRAALDRSKYGDIRKFETVSSKLQSKLRSSKTVAVPTTVASRLSPSIKQPLSPPSNKFSIDEILKRKDPERPVTVLSMFSNYPLPGTTKSFDLEDAEEGDIFNSNTEFHDECMDTASRFSWLQCTRYKPPKLPRLKKKEGGKKRKLGRNPRVPFTQHQVAALEQKFHRTHYLSSADVAELSTALNLTETRVKIWFQNRRARERRDRDGGPKPDMLGQKASSSSSSTASFPMSAMLAWPSPLTPSPSVAHFSNALIPGGKSAFKPVPL